MYRHEAETPALLRQVGGDVDSYLFTGVVPYEIAGSHGLVDRVAEYVEYGDSALLAAIVGLLRSGHDVPAMSIDTLSEEQVQETLESVGIPREKVSVLPYQLGQTPEQVVAFHRSAHQADPSTVALTCRWSVHDEIAGDLLATRLVPSRTAIRAVITRIRLLYDSHRSGDAQVVVGLVDIDPSAEEALTAELGDLGATVVKAGPRRFLAVATRGPLEEATSGFTTLPMLGRLKTRYPTVRMGFGVGGSGAEAHALARRALGRAEVAGRVAAVASLRNQVDIVLSQSVPPRGAQRTSLAQLAQRSGLSVATLREIQDYVRERGDADITTRDLSMHLEVQPRTARRILNRLERAGLARSVGTRSPGGNGRPLVVYRVRV